MQDVNNAIIERLEKEYWSLIKTFLLYLNRLPEYPGALGEVDPDDDVLDLLKDI